MHPRFPVIIGDRAFHPAHIPETVTVSAQSAEAACLLLWFFRLTPEGELAQFEWIHFGAEYEKRVMHRLDTLNQFMRSGH